MIFQPASEWQPAQLGPSVPLCGSSWQLSQVSCSIGFICMNVAALLSRIHGEEEFERRRVDRKNVDIIERQTSIRKTIAAFGILSVTFSQAFTMLIVAGCAVLIIRGQMLVGSLVLFLTQWFFKE